MKNLLLLFYCAAALIITSCGGNTETKTLYGSWEPILMVDEATGKWVPAEENFIISVSGSCEEIVVEKTETGDLANPDVPMANAKCFGNRDELSFTDTISVPTAYSLKMDSSKDTLTGTSTSDFAVGGTRAIKMKFRRI